MDGTLYLLVFYSNHCLWRSLSPPPPPRYADIQIESVVLSLHSNAGGLTSVSGGASAGGGSSGTRSGGAGGGASGGDASTAKATTILCAALIVDMFLHAPIVGRDSVRTTATACATARSAIRHSQASAVPCTALLLERLAAVRDGESGGGADPHLDLER